VKIEIVGSQHIAHVRVGPYLLFKSIEVKFLLFVNTFKEL
jgi:hypothetical protein